MSRVIDLITQEGTICLEVEGCLDVGQCKNVWASLTENNYIMLQDL